MTRKTSYSENKEIFLESILSHWRICKAQKYIPEKSKVLDLGCGYQGSLLKKIKKNISKGIGVDISVDKSFSDDKIRLIEHNLNEPFPFSDSEFDVVASLANLEHLNDSKKTLKEIHRVLKPGGLLLLTAPSAYAKPVLEFLSLIGLVSRKEIKDHKHYFNKKVLATLCQKAGFSEISHKYFQLGMNNFLIAEK